MIDFSTAFYVAFGFSLASGIAGYYLGTKGWTGVQDDLNIVKLDIANIKGYFRGPIATSATIPVVTTNPTGPNPQRSGTTTT